MVVAQFMNKMRSSVIADSAEQYKTVRETKKQMKRTSEAKRHELCESRLVPMSTHQERHQILGPLSVAPTQIGLLLQVRWQHMGE